MADKYLVLEQREDANKQPTVVTRYLHLREIANNPGHYCIDVAIVGTDLVFPLVQNPPGSELLFARCPPHLGAPVSIEHMDENGRVPFKLPGQDVVPASPEPPGSHIKPTKLPR